MTTGAVTSKVVQTQPICRCCGKAIERMLKPHKNGPQKAATITAANDDGERLDYRLDFHLKNSRVLFHCGV